MHRRTAVCTAVLWVFLCSFCGCTQKVDPPLPAAFTATAEITHGEFSCRANLTRQADGTLVTHLESPAALQALTVSQNETDCIFTFFGKEIRLPAGILPDAAFAKLVYAALQSAQSSSRCVKTRNGDVAVYSGMTAVGDTYTLTQDRETGALLTLTMQGQKLKADFSSFQAA